MKSEQMNNCSLVYGFLCGSFYLLFSFEVTFLYYNYNFIFEFTINFLDCLQNLVLL